MKTRKVAVIGLGHVGAHVAYSIAIQGIADELLLIDQNQSKLISECQDLRDAVAYMPHKVIINAGDFPDLVDCDVIVNCIGNIGLLLDTMDRWVEMEFTISAVNGFVQKIKDSGFDGVLINISNPCDIVTRQIAKALDMPRGKVFGTGTGLDTSRLLSELSLVTGIAHKSINAYMIGEHGAAQFAPWSCATFGGRPLDEWAKEDERFRFDRDEMKTKAIKGGWITISGKFCTEYGICSTAARMVSIILHDEKVIMPVSAYLDGEYGEKDIFVGVPAILGKNGVEKVVELPLTKEEQDEFHRCCDQLRKGIEAADKIK